MVQQVKRAYKKGNADAASDPSAWAEYPLTLSGSSSLFSGTSRRSMTVGAEASDPDGIAAVSSGDIDAGEEALYEFSIDITVNVGSMSGFATIYVKLEHDGTYETIVELRADTASSGGAVRSVTATGKIWLIPGQACDLAVGQANAAKSQISFVSGTCRLRKL